MSTEMVVALIVLFLLWRVSLIMLPDKLCKACGGKGYRGWKVMNTTCGNCMGKGRVKRIGAKG